MRALGFDPSLRNYGWAAYNSDAPVPSLRKVASGREGTVPLTVPVARFIHFRALVANLLRRYKVDVVGIESPAFSGGPFSEAHYGLMLFTLEAVFDRRVDCVLFDPSTVKLLVGKGNAKKSDIIDYVQRDLMTSLPLSSDEADAYCIAKFAARFMLLRRGELSPDDLSSGEQRAFLTRSRRKKKSDGSVSVKRTAHVFRANSRFFEFSKVPSGSVNLPNRSDIDPRLIDWLESGKWQRQR